MVEIVKNTIAKYPLLDYISYSYYEDDEITKYIKSIDEKEEK